MTEPRPHIDTSDVTLADTGRHIASRVTSSDGERAYRVTIVEVDTGAGLEWWPACTCKAWRIAPKPTPESYWCKHAAATFGAWHAHISNL